MWTGKNDGQQTPGRPHRRGARREDNTGRDLEITKEKTNVRVKYSIVPPLRREKRSKRWKETP